MATTLPVVTAPDSRNFADYFATPIDAADTTPIYNSAVTPSTATIAATQAKPIVNRELANLSALSALIPQQLNLAAQLGPQIAAVQGNNLAATLKAFLPQYEETIAPTISRIGTAGQSAQRTADIADVQALAPGARAAFEALDPESAQFVRLIQQAALSQFPRNPSELTPLNRRRSEQNVRSAQAARGGGFGTSATWEEAMQLYLAGDAQRRAAEAEGAAAIGIGRGFYGDPFQSILGRPSNVAALTPEYARGIPAQGNLGIFDTINNPGLQNWNATLFGFDQNIKNLGAAGDAADKALLGSVIQAVGSLAGGAAAGGV